MIHMIIFDIRHDSVFRIKLQKRSVTLISFGDHIRAGAITCVTAQAAHLAADDDRRIYL